MGNLAHKVNLFFLHSFLGIWLWSVFCLSVQIPRTCSNFPLSLTQNSPRNVVLYSNLYFVYVVDSLLTTYSLCNTEPPVQLNPVQLNPVQRSLKVWDVVILSLSMVFNLEDQFHLLYIFIVYIINPTMQYILLQTYILTKYYSYFNLHNIIFWNNYYLFV